MKKHLQAVCLSGFVIFFNLAAPQARTDIVTVNLQGHVSAITATDENGNADNAAFQSIIPFSVGDEVNAMAVWNSDDFPQSFLASTRNGLLSVNCSGTVFDSEQLRLSFNSNSNPTRLTISGIPHSAFFPDDWLSDFSGGSIASQITLEDNSGGLFADRSALLPAPLDETDFDEARFSYLERNNFSPHTWTTPLGSHLGMEHRIDVVFSTLQVTAQAVPEPGSLICMLPVVGLVLCRRSRRSQFQTQAMSPECHYRKAIPVFALAVLLPIPLSGDIVIDDDFSGGSSYLSNSSDLTGNPDSISFASFTIISSGGNPDHYFEATHHHDVIRDGNGQPPGGDGFTSVESTFTNQSSPFTPETDGLLGKIVFEIDVRVPVGSAARELSFVLDGNSFVESFSFDDQVVPDGTWQNVELEVTPIADLIRGEDVFFGFGFISDADVTFGAETHGVDFDNFRVTVSAVPEPNMLFAFSVVTGGISLTRRR